MKYFTTTSAAKVYDAAVRYCEADILSRHIDTLSALTKNIDDLPVPEDLTTLSHRILHETQHDQRLIILNVLTKVATIARDPNIDNLIISVEDLFREIVSEAKANWVGSGRKSTNEKAEFVRELTTNYITARTNIDNTVSVWDGV